MAGALLAVQVLGARKQTNDVEEVGVPDLVVLAEQRRRRDSRVEPGAAVDENRDVVLQPLGLLPGVALLHGRRPLPPLLQDFAQAQGVVAGPVPQEPPSQREVDLLQ